MQMASLILAAMVSVASGATLGAPVAQADGPAHVRIVHGADGYQLRVDGKPFYVKGAGLAHGSQEELAARGGNSFRTWSTGTDRRQVLAMLDRARRNGLMVAMGIDVASERHGFDYNDADAVAHQLVRIRREVQLYKDHPAVLMWVAGNELNLEHSNPAVWNAVGQIADMIHRTDPQHPVTTTLAGFDSSLIARRQRHRLFQPLHQRRRSQAGIPVQPRGRGDQGAVPVRFRPGQRLKCWHKNCVALGLAGSFIEPLESTTIHLIQRGIVHLLQMFPQVIAQPDIDQYNAQLDSELQHVRDFVVLHYHLTRRRDTPYWQGIAQMDIPPTLQHRIELFRETGRVFRVPDELFAENSWIQVMMGQGIAPKRFHPAAGVMSEPDLVRFLDDIRTNVDSTVSRLPAHMDYLRSYCPGPKP